MRIIVSSDSQFELPAGAEAAGVSLLRLGVDVELPEGSGRWGFPDWSKWVKRTLRDPSVKRWGVVDSGLKPAFFSCVQELLGATCIGLSHDGRLIELLPGASHDQRISSMVPSPRWRIFVDETGSKFGGQEANHSELGRFVAIACPSTSDPSLKDLPPDFHAVEASRAAIEAALSAVLRHSAGVLGVSSECFASTKNRDYDAGLFSAILLVLRTLPVPVAGEVIVEVITEERSHRKARKYWTVVEGALLRELHLSHPGLARRLRLSVRDARKGTTTGTAMADVVAYVWSTTSRATEGIRNRWGKLGMCFLDDPRAAEALRRAHASRRPGRPLPTADWLELFNLADAGLPGAPVEQFLSRLADEARRDAGLFQAYLAAAANSLETKGYDLRVLQRQAAWLKQAAPDDQVLPPRISLLVAMHALATGNHAGEAGAEAEEAVLELLDGVWEEDIKLACLAALHVAVRRTNAYAFEDASDALAVFVGIPPIALGLNLTGRLYSSLGQHSAFQGDPAAAVAAFDTALASFERISDPKERAGERAQTMTYRALALLDLEGGVHAREGIDALIGGLDQDAIQRLAASGDDHDRWHQHALVRFLAERGTDDDIAAYLAARQSWQTGPFHPWALIHTYRAVILHPQDADAAKVQVERALALLAGAPDTLAVMRAAIERVAVRMGVDVAERTDLGALRDSLPAAVPYLDALAALPDEGPLLEPLRAALPFNFR